MNIDTLDVVTTIMCNAIEKADAWYCEILTQRYSGKDASEAAYKKLATLDAEALRAVELYHKMTMDAFDSTPGF